MLTIYSLGDPWYLGKVMDAIAMISGSKSGFIGASEVAALIGVLIVGFQSILRLQINIHHLLVCYIVYMGCFSTTTDVAIESVYSDKTVIQKDNVPLGPAVLGSVISQIGYGLTQKMEIAFSDIDEAKMTNGKSNGYLNPLHVLNNLANWSENGELLDYMLNTPQGRNLSRNYILYVADCTTKSVFLGRQWGGKTWNDVFSQSFGNDIKFKSDLYGTEFINSSDQAEVLSCTEGYDKLMEQINLALTQVLGDSKKAQNILNKIGQCQGGSCQETLGLTSPIETIEQALEALNLGSVDAQKFMLNGMLENLKKTGLAAGFKHYRDVNTANMLYQSIQQRNLQWASEGNIFLNAMRPMMAFIEGFFYAISPFAAIIMLLGLFGLNIFFKYIMLLLWIQLWTPIMAIANLFIITSAKQALNPLTLTDTTALEGGAISTYYYESIVQVCQDKIAVGSMMLAATPVLSLMIISGSVYAFTSLTNRIAGADHFNEKVLAPDIASAAPVMNHQAMFNSDNYGFTKTGALMDSYNVGADLSTLAQRSKMDMLQKADQIGTTMTNITSNMGTFESANSINGTYNRLTATSHGEGLANLTQKVRQYAESNNLQLGKNEEQGVAMALSRGLKGVTFGASGSEGLTQNQVEAINKINQDGRVEAEELRATITSTVSGAFSEAFGTNDKFVKAGGDSQQLQQASSDLRAATEQYQKSYSLSQKVGVGASYKENDIINNAVNNLGKNNVQTKINSALSNLNTHEKNGYEANLRKLMREVGTDIGSNGHEMLQLRALKGVDTYKASLLAAELLYGGTGTGIPTSGMEDNLTKASTNDVASDVKGYDPVLGGRILNESNNRKVNAEANSTAMTPEAKAMVSEAQVQYQHEGEVVGLKEKEKTAMKEEKLNNLRNKYKDMISNPDIQKSGVIERVIDQLSPSTFNNTLKNLTHTGDYVVKEEYDTLKARKNTEVGKQFQNLANKDPNNIIINETRDAFVTGKLVEEAATVKMGAASNPLFKHPEIIASEGGQNYNTIKNSLRTHVNDRLISMGMDSDEATSFTTGFLNKLDSAVVSTDLGKRQELINMLNDIK